MIVKPIDEILNARKAEDVSFSSFAESIAAARLKAVQLESAPIQFAMNWKRLLRTYVQLFDLTSAERVVKRAVHWHLPGSSDQSVMFQRMLEEIRPSRALVESARMELHRASEEKARDFSEGRIALFVPTIALDAFKEGYVFSGIRKILASLREAMDSAGIPYAVYGRLNNHGTPLVSDHIRYISHHTIDPRGMGLHFKLTDRPHCFSFDSMGYSGWSALADVTPEEVAGVSQAEADECFHNDRTAVIGGNVSKYQQRSTERLDGEPWIFVPLQTAKDAVQQLAYVPMLRMLEEVIAVGNENRIPVVVKRHPQCRDKEISNLLRKGASQGRFRVSEASIHSLISGSCAVCTVNSSVGAEALLHMKPVYLFGRSEYQFGCHRMTVPGDFKRAFRPNVLPIPENDIRKFLYLLRHAYSHDINSPGFRPFLDRKVAELSSQSFDALMKN